MGININVTPGNNPNINVTPQTSNNISAVTSETDINVCQVGIQGPAGVGTEQNLSGFAGVASINGASGQLSFIGTGNVVVTVNGQTFIFSGIDTSGNSNVNLYGFITTGDGDSRYLASGSSGFFYPWSNPNQFIRSGELTQANTSGFVTSGDLENTGTALQSQIDNLNIPSVEGFPTSGELESTGTALQNQLGNYYLDSNPNQFSDSGNVEATGTSLQNQINNIVPSSSGLAGSGDLEATGTALQNQIDALSSPAAASTGDTLAFIFGNQQLPTGLLQNYFVGFPQNFALNPLVFGELLHTGGDPSIAYRIKSTTTSGFYLNFTDILYDDQYYFQFIATTGVGFFQFAFQSTGSSTSTSLVSYNILRSGDTITGLNYENGNFTQILRSGDYITGVINSNYNKKILYDSSNNITGVLYY